MFVLQLYERKFVVSFIIVDHIGPRDYFQFVVPCFFCGFDSTIILLSFLDSCLIIAVMATFSCYLQQKWKAKLCQDQTGQTMQSTFVKWPRGIYQGKMKCRNCRRAIFVMYP